MSWWNRRQMPTDERVQRLKQQIYTEAYFLAIAICGVSLIYKSWVLDLGIEAAFIEFLVLVVSGLYFMARSVTLGIVADEAEMHDRGSRWSLDRKTAVAALMGALILALVLGIRNATLYGDDTTWLQHFVLIFVATFLINAPLLVITSVVGTKLARKLSEKATIRNRD